MITLIIAAVTVITSIRAFSNPAVSSQLIFAPHYIRKTGEWYRFFSHGLIHADWIHLLFNMIAFYSFGTMVENTFISLYPSTGRLIYIALYLLALPASSIYDYIKHKDNPSYMALGASGAVSAIIFATILISPTSGIYLFLIPIPIPAYIFGPLFLLFTLYMARTSMDKVAHEAHFFGALFGLLFMTILIPGIWIYFIEQL